MTSRGFTFLIDTNVFVTLEPFGLAPAHEPFDEAARFAQRVHEHGLLAIHEASREDLLRDDDESRRAHNLCSLAKYVTLRGVPISATVAAVFPTQLRTITLTP